MNHFLLFCQYFRLAKLLYWQCFFTEDPTPCVAIAALMKLSFDEEHRHAMCQLGALQAIATLIQVKLPLDLLGQRQVPMTLNSRLDIAY